MISYAQNGEDVVLRRAFTSDHGTFVDVGAGGHTIHSVTRAFHDAGWAGISVEPHASFARELRASRPQETVIEALVGACAGSRALYCFTRDDVSGQSSVIRGVADGVAAATGAAWERRDIRVVTLADVWSALTHPSEVDFLKIDIEGAETEVITATDWVSVRPKCIVVEAIDPVTREPSHEAWEPVLEAAGYAMVLFDGINRFYAASEAREIHQALSYPACAIDGFIRYEDLLRQHEVTALRARFDAARARADGARTDAEVASLRIRECEVTMAEEQHLRRVAEAALRHLGDTLSAEAGQAARAAGGHFGD